MSLLIPPVVGYLPEVYHVHEGSDVRIRCDAISTPHPHWRWHKLVNNVTSDLLEDTDTLHLHNVTASDAGQYTCEVGNVHGLVRRVTHLVVLNTGDTHTSASVVCVI